VLRRYPEAPRCANTNGADALWPPDNRDAAAAVVAAAVETAATAVSFRMSLRFISPISSTLVNAALLLPEPRRSIRT
jgi:hypothetical protein